MDTVKVLVVEDNPVDVLRLRSDLRELQDPEFQITHAESLAQAKEVIRRDPFDLVLLDLGLPDGCEIGTLVEIQEVAPDIPVVVMSGTDDELLAREAVAKGAQDYLLKDKWDAQLIVRSLDYALQRHHLLSITRRANEASRRANRALLVLTECNQLLVRATEEQALLDDICSIIVDHGGYHMAWIGFAVHDKSKTVKPVAVAGYEDDYLQIVKITWSEDETGRGPVGTAIRTGKTYVNRDTETNPDYGPWRDQALKRGYASSMALPLRDRSGIFGAVAIYANESNAFDSEEVKLLGQLADDLGYGLSTLRLQAAKKKADLALHESEQRFRAMFEGAQDYIFLRDRSLRFTLVNPAVEKLFGIAAAQIVGKKYEDLFGQESAQFAKDLDSRVLQGESIEGEHTWRLHGSPRTFLETRTPLRDDAGNIVGICNISRDITERRRTEFSPSHTDVGYPSESMKYALGLARVSARKDSTILLLGESGSGKDYLARYIHDCSSRADGPYLSVNCAAIAAELAESELFGHERGAFTGAHDRKRGLVELAEGGTLLLNEIGELSLPLQAKLLTFLDTKKVTRVGGEKEISVNARLIAATNRDLAREVDEGTFRKDLYYRINVLSITVPPLRERREDIPVLAQDLLSRLSKEMKTVGPPTVDAATMRQLTYYNWPGNVRELRNVLERAMILSPNGHLNIELPHVQTADDEEAFQSHFASGLSLPEATDALAKSLCMEALRVCNGNKRASARMLGIARDTLYRYMKKFGMESEDYES